VRPTWGNESRHRFATAESVPILRSTFQQALQNVLILMQRLVMRNAPYGQELVFAQLACGWDPDRLREFLQFGRIPIAVVELGQRH
jgi:hypothetical protein